MKKIRLAYRLDTVIPFGKYKNITFNTVIDVDPEYALWFVDNVKGTFSNDIMEKLFKDNFKWMKKK